MTRRKYGQSIIRKIDWQDAGFEVIGDAENGKEALEKIEQNWSRMLC